MVAPIASLSGTHAVVEMNDPASEPALIQEFELRTDVLRQCALAPTHDDRPEEQMALVDHPRGNRPPGQLGAPIAMSTSEVSLSLRIVAGSKLGSIRVLTLDAVWSVREYTIFSAARRSQRSPASQPANQHRCRRSPKKPSSRTSGARRDRCRLAARGRSQTHARLRPAPPSRTGPGRPQRTHQEMRLPNR